MSAPRPINKKQKPSILMLLLYIAVGVFWFNFLFVSEYSLICSLLWSFFWLGFYSYANKKWHELNAEKERKNAERAKDMKEHKATAYGFFRHISGLSLPENLPCSVYYTSTGIEVFTGNQQIKIPHSKIVDLNIKTDTEIQKHLVSSVGGAAFGHWAGSVFGSTGAMIGTASGGRIQEGETRQVHHYLIIFYKKTKSAKKTDFVIFDVTNNLDSNDFVDEFDKDKPSTLVTKL